MAFPLSPVNGQTATLNSITYVYNSTSTSWTRVPAVNSTSSASPPSNPKVGDIWYDSGTDDMFRYTSDGVSSYWLDITGPTQANSVTFLNTNIYANSFNGSSQYLSVPTNAAFQFGTGDFTIEGWFYVNSLAPASQSITAFRSGDSLATLGWGLLVIGNQLYFGPSNGTTNYNIYHQTTLSVSTWYHAAVVRSGTVITIYLNGVAGTSPQTVSAGYTINGSGPTVYVGYASSGSTVGLFNGYISNLRIVKGTALYTAAFTVPTPPLTAIANTSLLTCQTVPVTDASSNAFAVTNVGGVVLSIYAAQQTPLVTLPIIPTRTILNTAGSGTYTVPAYTKWITVRMVGGGGGGGGSGTGATQSAGGAGTNSVFDTITANAASATGTNNVQAGNGGGYSLGAYSGFGIPGASGSAGQDTGSSLTSGFLNSGAGGSSPFGGAGGAKNTGVGRDAQNNSGSGGSGGGGGYNTANFFYGPGGGAGGYVEGVCTRAADQGIGSCPAA